jgi:hypothetical protein
MPSAIRNCAKPVRGMSDVRPDLGRLSDGWTM